MEERPESAGSVWRQPKAVWAVAFACVVAFMGLVDPILPAISKPPRARSSWCSRWILVRDEAERVEIRSHEILRDEEAGKYPSDHYPVLAELDLIG